MRKLYYDDQFARQLSELELHVPRIREFLRGLASKLKRNPEFGTQVRDNPPVWFAGMPDLIEQPLGVSYTFDDNARGPALDLDRRGMR